MLLYEQLNLTAAGINNQQDYVDMMRDFDQTTHPHKLTLPIADLANQMNLLNYQQQSNGYRKTHHYLANILYHADAV